MFASAIRSTSAGNTLRSSLQRIRLLLRHQSNTTTKSTTTATETSSSPSAKNNTIILDPLVVCGPSGVGKGTVIKRFMEVQQEQYDEALKQNERMPQRKQFEKPIFLEFVFAVSHTTRPPRPNEVDGVHYHFVNKHRMTQLTSLVEAPTNDTESKQPQTPLSSPSSPLSSYFVEHATVHGNMYGTSWDAINKVHGGNQKTIGNTRIVRKALLDIDIQGVQHLKRIEQEQKDQIEQGKTIPFLLQPKYIFIAPPNLQSLQERLEARGTESTLSLQTRTNNAIQEMNYGLEMLRYALDETLDVMYRKSNNFHTVIVNGVSVNDTVDEFMICVDRIYNLKDFERPEHINANNYEPEEHIQVYEDMMYK